MSKTLVYIEKEDAVQLKPGAHVYINMMGKTKDLMGQVPAMVLQPREKDHITLAYLTQSSVATVNMPLDSYTQDWTLKKEIMSVETPHGKLIIEDKHDDEYPGVWVNLQTNPNHKETVTLAMIEYIPGGEFIDTKTMPSNSTDEVLNRTSEFNKTVHRINAGFVTRAFPDDTHDDKHHITLHHGYKQYAECRINKKTMSLIDELLVCTDISALNPNETLPITYTARFPDGMQAILEITQADNNIARGIVYLQNIDGHTCGTLNLFPEWRKCQMHLTCDNGVDYVLTFQEV